MKIKYVGEKFKMTLFKPLGSKRRSKDVFIFEKDKIYEVSDEEGSQLLKVDGKFHKTIDSNAVYSPKVKKVDGGYVVQQNFIEVADEKETQTEEEAEETGVLTKKRGRPKKVDDGDTLNG